MTDGPFAYPLNLWLFGRDARGPEPIQRSISSSLLDFPMPLSSLPSVRPFGISLSDPRWFLLLLLESSLVSSRPFHVTGILSCVSSVAIVPLFFSLLYFPIVGYSYVSFMFLFLDDLSLSLFLSFQSVTFGEMPLLFLRAFLSSTSLLLAQYCFEIRDNDIPFKQAQELWCLSDVVHTSCSIFIF